MKVVGQNTGVRQRSCILAFFMVLGINPAISKIASHIMGDSKSSQPKVVLPSCNDMDPSTSTSAGNVRELLTETPHNQSKLLGFKHSGKQDFAETSYVQAIPTLPNPVDSPKKKIPNQDLLTFQQQDLLDKKRKKILQVREHHFKIRTKITKITNLEPNSSPEYRFPESFYQHMDVLEKITNQLYSRKILEIKLGRKVLLETDQVLLPGDLVDEIFLKVIEGPFSSFKEAPRSFRLQPLKVWNVGLRAMMSHWSDLMIDFFRDLKQIQLVSPENLVEFKKKDQGQLFTSFLIAMFPQYDVLSTYINFDLRSSIAEDRNLKDNLKDIFHGLDEKTWQQAEYQFIKYKLIYEEGRCIFHNFQTIREEFLSKAPPENSRSLPEMKKLLEKIIHYISGVEFDWYPKEKLLMHFKVIHDMLKFIQRYHPEVISDEFKKSTEYQKLHTFEEVIQMISCINHFSYELFDFFVIHFKKLDKTHLIESMWHREEEPIHSEHISEILDEFTERLKGSNYLTGLNKNQRVPNPKERGASMEHEKMIQLLINGSERYKILSLKIWHVMQLPWINEDNILLKSSKERAEEQYIRYLIEIKKLKENENGKDQDFSEIIERLELMGLQNFIFTQDKFQNDLRKYEHLFSSS